MADQPGALRDWHEIVRTRDVTLLDGLLADDVVFRSPAVIAPQEGKAAATLYLTGAVTVLGPTLRYVHEWHDAGSAVLEFEAELGGRLVHGVDLLRWNDAGQLTSFTVMVRPLRGLEKLIGEMSRALTAAQPG